MRSILPSMRRLDGSANSIIEFFQLWATWINRIDEWDIVSGDGTTSMIIHNNTVTQLYIKVFPDPNELSFIRAEILSDAVGTHQTEGHAIMHIPGPDRDSYLRNERYIEDNLTELYELFNGIDTQDALSAPIRFWITLTGPHDSLVICTLVNGCLSSMHIGTPEDLSLSWARDLYNKVGIMTMRPQEELEEVAAAMIAQMPCFSSYMQSNYACTSSCAFKSLCQEHTSGNNSLTEYCSNTENDSAYVEETNVEADEYYDIIPAPPEYTMVWENRRTGNILEEKQKYEPRSDIDTPEKFYRAVLATYNKQEKARYGDNAPTRRLIKIIDPEGVEDDFTEKSDRFDLIDI